MKVHTHVELAHKACHVVVLEVFGQNLFGKPALVKDMEAGTRLNKRNKAKKICSVMEYQILQLNDIYRTR